MRDARIEPRRGNTACLEVRPVIGARNPCARASHLMAVCAGPRNCAFKRKWSGCPKKVDPDKLNSGGCRHEWSRLGKHDSTVLPRSGLLATHSCPSARRSHRSRAAIRSRTVSVHSTAMNGFSDNPYAKAFRATDHLKALVRHPVDASSVSFVRTHRLDQEIAAQLCRGHQVLGRSEFVLRNALALHLQPSSSGSES